MRYFAVLPLALAQACAVLLHRVDRDHLHGQTKGILGRFKAIVELTFRRYLDLERAEAQAREAQIETALEKVRAVAMSMTKPRDLLDVSETLFRQLQALGFPELRNAMINIHDDEKGAFINYDYSDAIGRTINNVPYTVHPLVEKWSGKSGAQAMPFPKPCLIAGNSRNGGHSDGKSENRTTPASRMPRRCTITSIRSAEVRLGFRLSVPSGRKSSRS